MTPVDVLMAYWRRHERVQRRLEEIRAERTKPLGRPGCFTCSMFQEALPSELIRAAWLRHSRREHRFAA